MNEKVFSLISRKRQLRNCSLVLLLKPIINIYLFKSHKFQIRKRVRVSNFTPFTNIYLFNQNI